MSEEFHIKPEDAEKCRISFNTSNKKLPIGPFVTMEAAVAIQEWLANGGGEDIWELLEMPEGGLEIIQQQKNTINELQAKLKEKL